MKPVQYIHRFDRRQRLYVQRFQLADDLILHYGIRREGKQVELSVFFRRALRFCAALFAALFSLEILFFQLL